MNKPPILRAWLGFDGIEPLALNTPVVKEDNA
jgi:hypothetical protein